MVDDLQEPNHPYFKRPSNKDIKIWRYMDLARYLAILQQRSLFFSRATKLGDPFEGSSTKPMAALHQPGESDFFKELVDKHGLVAGT